MLFYYYVRAPHSGLELLGSWNGTIAEDTIKNRVIGDVTRDCRNRSIYTPLITAGNLSLEKRAIERLRYFAPVDSPRFFFSSVRCG